MRAWSKLITAVCIMMSVMLYPVRPAHAFLEYLPFGLWLYNELKGQTVREHARDGNVSIVQDVPPAYEQMGEGIRVDQISIEAGPAGQNIKTIDGWPTYLRFWAPPLGKQIEEIIVYRGLNVYERYGGDKLANYLKDTDHVDVRLPDGVSRKGRYDGVFGQTERWSCTIRFDDGDPATTHVNLTSMTLDQWRAQHLMYALKLMDRVIGGAGIRQNNPERTALIAVRIPNPNLGVTVRDTVGGNLLAEAAVADAFTAVPSDRMSADGVLLVKVKPGKVRVSPSTTGYTLVPRPHDMADFTYNVIEGQVLEVALQPVRR